VANARCADAVRRRGARSANGWGGREV